MTYRIRNAALSLAVLCVLAAPSLSFAAPPITTLGFIPNQTATTGSAYSYTVPWSVSNPSCYAGHSFSLTQKPSGMTINSAGKITWNPAQPTANYTITVRLVGYSDCIGIGNSDTSRTFVLSVCT